jgi:tetratricopeptide (TPR) repeat protein
MSADGWLPRLRVVTVGIDKYTHFEQQLPQALAHAKEVAEIFADKAESVSVPSGGEAEVWQGLQSALPKPATDRPSPNGLLIYWAGHGYLQEESTFCLAASDTDPDATSMITLDRVADFAARTDAGQILMVIDACFAGAGVKDAMARAMAIIEARAQYHPKLSWIGVLASAMDWQEARDDLFGPQFLHLLRSGPTTDYFKKRWTADNQAIDGEDLIQALDKEWAGPPTQRLKPLRYGSVERFLPNPLFQRDRLRGFPAQLIDAATGGEGGDGGFFSGRKELLGKLVEVVRNPQPGMHVLTGPPGCGKSAVLGWLVCRSDPQLRATIKGRSDITDPGELSITAGVVARGMSAKQLTNCVDEGLSNGFIPADRAGQRGIGELLDAIRATGHCPVVVVDGLDEAGVDETGQNAWAVAEKVLRPLATVASVIVGTRDRPPQTPVTDVASPSELQPAPELRATSLVAALTADTGRVFNMLELVDEPGDIESYVAARLDGIDAAMDPVIVASYINEIPDADIEGRFLLARLLTDGLRESPIDTHLPNWRELLADSVEDSFDQTIADLGPMPRNGAAIVGAAKDLLVALTWAYGAGMPDDVWAQVATALSEDGTRYSRTDVFWALDVAGRFIVEDGNGTQAVYRLAHERLAEHLVSETAEDAAVKVAQAVQELLVQGVEAGRDPEAHTYLWQHAWQHCAQAGYAGIALLERVEEQAPDSFRLDLALALDAVSDLLADSDQVAAIEVGQRAVELLREIDDEEMIPTRIAALSRLATLHADQGQLDEAAALSKEAVEEARNQAEDTRNPWDTSTRAAPTLADALYLHAMIQRLAGDLDEAVEAADEAIDVYRIIVQTSPDYRFDLASALTQAGLTYRDAAQPDRALWAIRQATQMFAELAESSPDYRFSYATSLSNLGLVSRDSGNLSGALQPALDAVALQRELASEDPEIEPALALALSNLGLIYRDMGRPADAIEPLTDAVAYYERHLDAHPVWTGPLMLALNNLSVSLRDVGRLADAIPGAERAVALGREATDELAVKPHLALALGNLALAYVDLGNMEHGTALAKEALDRYDELIGDEETMSNASVLEGGARMADSVGQLLLASGQAQLAQPFAERGASLYESLAEINRTARPSWSLARAHLGLVYLAVGRHLEAAPEIQTAHVMIRNYVDSVPEEQRSTGLIAQLAEVVSCVAVLFKSADAEFALPLAEESARLYRQLAKGQPVYRRFLIEVLVLWGDLAATIPDRERASTMLAELADELKGLVGPGRALRLRIASGLARLAIAASNFGDLRGGSWAREAAALIEPEPGDSTTLQEAEQLASTVLSTRVEVLTSQATAAKTAGDLDQALQAAEDCVTTARSLTNPMLRPTQLAKALIMLAGIAQSAGNRDRASSAAREALDVMRATGAQIPYLLTLAQTSSVLSWASDDPELPSRVYEELPDDLTRLSVLLLTLTVTPEVVVTEQLIAGEAWTSSAPAYIVLTWHERCRQRRAQDPAVFDGAWLESHDDVPAWLKVDPKVVRLVNTWMNFPSVQETYEFHQANAKGLADPTVRTVLEEYAMANPAAPYYLDRLTETAEIGIEEAYAQSLLFSLVDQLKATDVESWPRLLAQHRDLLSDPDLLDQIVSDLTDGEPDDQLVAAALALAARDKDAVVFAAVADSDRVQPLLTQLADDPEATVHATFILLALEHLGPPETVEALFARAIGLARLGQSDEASELAEEVAAAEPERKSARLQELIRLAATVTQVGPLLQFFAP